MDIHHEKLLGKFMELCSRAGIRLRPTWKPGINGRWYADLGMVDICSFTDGGSATIFADGKTPEEALDNLFIAIKQYMTNPDNFFRRYSCPSNVNIPGDDPQAWVRWNTETDEWEDVKPTDKALAIHRIPADRVWEFRFLNKYR